jgi:hypothetical protein
LYVGHGTLVAEPGQPLRLCTVMFAPTGEVAPTCTFGVELSGLDTAGLPMTTTDGGLRILDGVRLIGTWDGTTLAVTQPLELARPEPEPWDPSTIPACPAGATGAPPVPDDFEQWKQYNDALDAFARDNPDLYAGRWASNSSIVELVVALTDDSEANRDAVTDVYPWACVVHRPNSEASLLALQAELQQAALPNGNRVLSSGTDPVASTLEVGVLVLDEPTRQWFEERHGDLVSLEGVVLRPL